MSPVIIIVPINITKLWGDISPKKHKSVSSQLNVKFWGDRGPQNNYSPKGIAAALIHWQGITDNKSNQVKASEWDRYSKGIIFLILTP